MELSAPNIAANDMPLLLLLRWRWLLRLWLTWVFTIFQRTLAAFYTFTRFVGSRLLGAFSFARILLRQVVYIFNALHSADWWVNCYREHYLLGNFKFQLPPGVELLHVAHRKLHACNFSNLQLACGMPHSINALYVSKIRVARGVFSVFSLWHFTVIRCCLHFTRIFVAFIAILFLFFI